MKLLIIVGTVRERRQSIKPAKAVRDELEEQGIETVFFDLKEKDIPLLEHTYYSGQGEAPEDVEVLHNQVLDSDGIVIVTPEYNHSIPGALKNALDYLYPEYDDKPFTYVTVSAGGFGGVRAQTHLNDLTLALGGYPGPSLSVSNVKEHFQDSGEVSSKYQEKIESFVEDTEEFVERKNC